MHIIKLLKEDNLYDLLLLHKEMHSLVNTEASNGAKVEALLKTLRFHSSVALGLFYNETLVGFSTGYSINPETFIWDNLYIQDGHRIQAKNLCTEFESIIKKQEYKCWEATLVEQRNKFAEHFGAEKIRTLYRKELK